jgi:hypothetical protein
MKTLIRTIRCDVTVERGARFQPTIVSVTPNGFTTGHPELKPKSFEIQSLSYRSTEVRDKGYSSSPNTKIDRDEGYSPSILVSILWDKKSLQFFSFLPRT